MNNVILTKENLLNHWQGHRALTRRVIEAFPEKELFEFTLGGMRPFSAMVHELLAIAVPGLQDIVSKTLTEFKEHTDLYKSKSELLAQWDKDTIMINSLYAQIPEIDFPLEFNLFGQYNNPLIYSIFYFIDNEIHHRGQAYVYLRVLNIDPPFFWER